MQSKPFTFSLLGTRIEIRPEALSSPLFLGGLFGWLFSQRYASRPWWQRLILIPMHTLLFFIVNLTHFAGHIISSAQAQAPIESVNFILPMPQSHYPEDAERRILPWQHRTRALGGPLANAFFAMVNGLLRFLFAPGTFWRETIDVNLFFHTLMGLGSLIPLPMVDGGSILKWTLVERGRAETQADEILCRVNLALGATTSTFGMTSLLMKRWGVALGFGLSSLLFILSGLSKLKN